jgi:MauM/NapG family ferredoxin protein
MDRRDFLKNVLALGGSLLGYGGWIALQQGRSSGLEQVLQPPGALPPADFASRCVRCLRCVDACPNHAIIALPAPLGSLQQGIPVIKARRQACMLCNRIEGQHLKCTEVCPTGALQLVSKEPDEILHRVAMGTAEIDVALCYSYNSYICGSCYRACPFPGKAMSLGMWEKPVVHTDGCVGCGLCERSCIMYPQAIRVKPRIA